MTNPVEFSVIIPVYNEAENLAQLAQEIAAALDGRAYEMIFIDDGSTDNTKAVMRGLKAKFAQLRAISHRQNAGQSRAVHSGVLAAHGPIIATLDGDGQNDPADLPDLYRCFTRQDAPPALGMVIGARKVRRDNMIKRLGSRIGNGVRRAILKDGNHDSACGIKVLPRALFLQLPYFDHMHRFMPALVQAQGRGVEIQNVTHRPRQNGISKYDTLGRAFVSIRDIRGVLWLARRSKRTGDVTEL